MYKRSRNGREDKSGAGDAKIWMRGTYLRHNNKKSLGDNGLVRCFTPSLRTCIVEGGNQVL